MRTRFGVSKYTDGGSSLMAQRVKDPTWLQLWHRFSPWPGNFCILQVQPKKNYTDGIHLIFHPISPKLQTKRIILIKS